MNMLGRIKIGTLLCSTNGSFKSGAVVLECIPLPKEMLVRKDMYDYDCLYILLTDFGNKLEVNIHEMLNGYDVVGQVNIKTRSGMIIANHQKVLDGLGK
jgi:hypothetical protein